MTEFDADVFLPYVGAMFRWRSGAANGGAPPEADMRLHEVERYRLQPGMSREPFSLLFVMRDQPPLVSGLHSLVHSDFEPCELLLSRVTVPEYERADPGAMFYEVVFQLNGGEHTMDPYSRRDSNVWRQLRPGGVGLLQRRVAPDRAGPGLSPCGRLDPRAGSAGVPRRDVETVDGVKEKERAHTLVEVVARPSKLLERFAFRQQFFERQSAAEAFEGPVPALPTGRRDHPGESAHRSPPAGTANSRSASSSRSWVRTYARSCPFNASPICAMSSP